jgi:arylsulfatase A-like enzyme
MEAKDGWNFEQCYAQSNSTEPSATTMLSGCYPETHKIVGTGGDEYPSPDIFFISEILRKHGYHTINIFPGGKWFKDRFHNFYEEQTIYDNGKVYDLFERLEHPKTFIYFHMMTTHIPYSANKEDFSKHLDFHEGAPIPEKVESEESRRAKRRFGELPRPINRLYNKGYDMNYIKWLYDSSIYYTDRIISKLVSIISKKFHDYLIIYTADHGESFDEHEIYLEHSCGLYEDQVHVPLIMKGTNISHKDIDFKVEHVDIVPTIFDLLDIEPNNDVICDGYSILQMIHDNEMRKEMVHFCENTWQSKRGLITDGKKFIETVGYNHQKGCPDIEIYDLLRDHRERKNIADKHSEWVQTFQKNIEEWLRCDIGITPEQDPLRLQQPTLLSFQQSRGRLTTEEVKLIEERLRRLGYI